MQKGYFQSKRNKMNTAIELCIRISLDTKFHLKLSILIFFDQICRKKEFSVENGKIRIVRASMVVTYYVNNARGPTDNGILMSLLLLVAETKNLA